MARIEGVNPKKVEAYIKQVLNAQSEKWGRPCSTICFMPAVLQSFEGCAGCGQVLRLRV